MYSCSRARTTRVCSQRCSLTAESRCFRDGMLCIPAAARGSRAFSRSYVVLLQNRVAFVAGFCVLLQPRADHALLFTIMQLYCRITLISWRDVVYSCSRARTTRVCSQRCSLTAESRCFRDGMLCIPAAARGSHAFSRSYVVLLQNRVTFVAGCCVLLQPRADHALLFAIMQLYCRITLIV